MTIRKIIVGIDGSVHAQRALRWAADEARLRGCELVLAHSTELASPSPDVMPSTDLQRASPAHRALLLDAEADAVSYGYDGDIRVSLSDRPPVDLLVQLGDESELVAVGTHGTGWRPGAMIGSVSHRVAGHARCPVVVVGPGTDHKQEHSDVVVGISNAPRCRPVVEFAFAEAALRQARIRAVHNWGDIDLSESAAWFLYRTGAEFRFEQERILLQALSPWTEAFPQVTVDVAVTADPIRERLSAESRTASLLVVGCRHHDGGWRPRLGATSTRVVQDAACPVAIVGHPARVEPDTGRGRTTVGRS